MHVACCSSSRDSLGMVPSPRSLKTDRRRSSTKRRRPTTLRRLPTSRLVESEHPCCPTFRSTTVRFEPTGRHHAAAGRPESIERRRQPAAPSCSRIIVGVQPDPRHPLSQPPYPPADDPRGQPGHGRHRGLRAAERPRRRRAHRQEHWIRALDRATLDEAKRNWRLMPATRDGVPFAQWHRLRVIFKLNEQ